MYTHIRIVSAYTSWTYTTMYSIRLYCVLNLSTYPEREGERDQKGMERGRDGGREGGRESARASESECVYMRVCVCARARSLVRVTPCVFVCAHRHTSVHKQGCMW